MLYQNEEEQASLAKLIEHRRVKLQLIELLRTTKEVAKEAAKEAAPQLKSLRTAKDMSCLSAVEELQKAVSNKWLKESDIADILGEAELAGNQHVMLFGFPGNNENESAAFLRSIANPIGMATKAANVKHYLTVPKRSTYQVLSSMDDEVVVKLVAVREYWTENVLEETDKNRIVYEKIRHEERCPVIVKASLSRKLIQIRVSPRQKGDSGSARNHYEFAIKALSGHYQLDDDNGWFQKMPDIPISDAFPAVINDHSLLIEMWSDTPEDRKVKSKFRNTGRPKLGHDLRGYKHWNHANGYARKAVSGFFSCGNEENQVLFARLNDDKIPKSFGRDRISRIFINRFCADEEIEYAISAIRAHI